MGSDDGGHPAVEVPAERDLLARRLRVEVDDHVVCGVADLLEHRVDLREGHPPRAQEHVALQVDDREADTALLDDAPTVAGLRGQEVRRTQDALCAIEIGVDLLALVGVVAQRDDVDARGEQLVGDLRGDAEAARGVLAVDDHELRRVLGDERREQRQQRATAEAADEVAHEQDLGGGVHLRSGSSHAYDWARDLGHPGRGRRLQAVWGSRGAA